MSDKKPVQIEFYAKKRFSLSYGALNTMRRSIKDLPEFMSLTFEQFMEVIKSDGLYAEEIEVYKATISWVKYDEKNRSELLPKLFLLVRLPLIQLKNLISIVENEKLVSSNSKCIDMLHNTYKILAMNKKELMNTIQFSESTIYNFRNHRSKQNLYLLSN